MKRKFSAALACAAALAAIPGAMASAQSWTYDVPNVEIEATPASTVKVGIGTTSPVSKLHVVSSGTTANSHLVLSQSLSNDWARLRFDAAGADFTLAVGGPTAYIPNTFNIYNPNVGDIFSATSAGNVGINNTFPSAKFQVTNGSVLFNGTTGTTPTSGGGTRMMYVPAKGGAFRTGKVTATEWNDANIGESSFAAGNDVIASGIRSFATGWLTTASGQYAMASGASTRAGGNAASAAGSYSQANADYSFATGYDTRATGISSFTAGNYSAASGNYSAAMGWGTTATGGKSLSLGSQTTAQAYASLVIGRYNVISGNSTTWTSGDPVFVVGNGDPAGARTNALTVLNTGNTHIGGSNPAGYMLYVSGNAYATGSWISSDARFKTNVSSVDGALAKVMSMRGVTYDFKRDEFKERNFPEGRQLGFIAQDLEKIVPEVVNTDTDGYKAVAYQNLTALLTEAIKEQQGTITGLRKENAELKARLQAIESRLGMAPAGGAGDLK